jgi:hypothetical protein
MDFAAPIYGHDYAINCHIYRGTTAWPVIVLGVPRLVLTELARIALGYLLAAVVAGDRRRGRIAVFGCGPTCDARRASRLC